MKDKQQHGGKRPGAGRKALDASPTERHEITMPRRLWDKARDIGGTWSAGIRKALEKHGDGD
jgi:hypothetical protein